MKFYAVVRGRSPGIYTTWEECQAQTSHFRGAMYKSFPALSEAQTFLTASNNSQGSRSFVQPRHNSPLGPIKRLIDDDQLTPALQKQRKLGDPPRLPHRDISEETVEPSLIGTKIVYPSGVVFLYTDGACQHKHCGVGYVLKDAAMTEIYKQHMFLGGMSTNNEAEYCALILGLRECVSRGLKSVVARLDSMLVVEQTKKTYKVRKEELKRFAEKVDTLVAQFEFFRIEHVYRRFNQQADDLSKEGLTDPDLPL